MVLDQPVIVPQSIQERNPYKLRKYLNKDGPTLYFISGAGPKHKWKYDYSLTEYKNNKEKVKIVCPVHGGFLQSPNKHLNSVHGCPKCSFELNSGNNESFLEKANAVHKGRYKYPELSYKNNRSRVTIVCSLHGAFEQKAMKHLAGEGCPRCSKEEKMLDKNHSFLSKSKFIEKSVEKWRNRFGYDKIDYTGQKNPVSIFCNTHQIFFTITPRDHIRGATGGCPECVKESLKKNHTKSLEEVISDFKKIHSEKYDYSLVSYISNREKIRIVCKKHGEFLQTPVRHLYGDGCPSCGYSSSKAETEIQRLSTR
jgi:hypothetical protein